MPSKYSDIITFLDNENVYWCRTRGSAQSAQIHLKFRYLTIVQLTVWLFFNLFPNHVILSCNVYSIFYICFDHEFLFLFLFR